MPENIAHGQVLALASLIDYQTGGIVSRIILKEKTGNITLFAFDAGQELSEHTAPFNALLHVLEGSAQPSVGGKAVPLVAGQAIVLPAGVPHAVKAVERFKMMLTMIKV